MRQKIAFGERINRWLDEPEGQTFKSGKWRFWLPMLLGFSLLNAVLTATIFGLNGNFQTYIGGIMLAVGVLIAWLCIGTLHYSDSRDAKLSKGVSILDSITLCFVIAHFCFLLWTQGHLMTLKAQENEYKASAESFNEKAEKISSDNVKIAEASAQAAKEVTKTARIQNDTAYQLRRAAESGNVKRPQIDQGLMNQSSSLSLSPIELEKPKKPEASSAAFLMNWDAWIRAANFGELILAAITFIFIRNRSAQFNAQRVIRDDSVTDDEFPSEIEGSLITDQSKARFDPERSVKTRTQRKDTVSRHSVLTQTEMNAIEKLREHLRVISSYHPGYSFKADLKDKGVWLRMMKAENGRQDTIHSYKFDIGILDAVSEIPDLEFRDGLINRMQKKGFPIETV